MASLRATREALLFAYREEWLDDMEFLVLNELNTSENLDFPYDSYDQFNLDDMDEAECIAELRFEKQHILRLEEVLQIPPLMKCNQRSDRYKNMRLHVYLRSFYSCIFTAFTARHFFVLVS